MSSPTFTNEEKVIFNKRKEEGYDITTDERYNLWFSLQIDVPQPPQHHSTASKVFATLPQVTKYPTFMPKSTARVVTSIECRREINEKEKQKAEALKLKKERRVER